MWQIAFYIGLIVLVNWAFDFVPLLALPDGELWSPVTLVVGMVFVARDFAQRVAGHKVIWAMLLAGAISWLMASPQVALASLAAFLLSEFTDWFIYTVTKRPFSQRIILSSAVSTPVDSLVFLGLLGLLSPAAFLTTVLSKMLGAVLVWRLILLRERKQEPLNA